MANQSSSKSFLFPVFALVVVVAAGIWGAGYMKANILDRNTTSIRVGFTGETLEALTIIAGQKGYFAEKGLKVELVPYDSGKLALEQGLLKGQVDIAPMANAPAVVSFMNGEEVRSLAVMGRADDQLKILAKKSSGITNISDIAGKRVLTQKGSAGHYFFSLFLDANKISSDDITMVYSDEVKSYPQMLASDRADIMVIKEPIFSQARELLGSDGVEFKPSKIFFKTFIYVTMQKFIDKNPETLEKYMSALYDAELYLQQDPEGAKQTVLAYPGMKKEVVEVQWGTQNIEMVIDDIYRTLSEEQAQWAIANKLTQTDRSREMDSFTYDGALRKVKPQGVY